jgi:hypothetical protein
MRFEDEILRANNTINLQANINAIVDNLGRLAKAASNMEITNIEWNPNVPFEVLKHIFENKVWDGNNHL